MKYQSVKYCGTFTDSSGYGDANRQDITALAVEGVDVTTELVVQMQDRSDYGWQGELCNELEDRTIPYGIKIIHLTPDMYPRYMEADKYNIGRLFWETDRLPERWVACCNQMQEIWTSSEGMCEVFRANGVKVPMFAFPQPIDIYQTDKQSDILDIPQKSGYMFYSVFQWIDRKNPQSLLRAYWKTFTGRTDVTLLIKTYGVGYTANDFEKIQLDIQRWKREEHLIHYPRVLIASKLLTKADMMRLHKTGDCYVSADRGEGWCRPLQEALLMGKPAITTARGGIHEYLNSELYYPIDSNYVPVQPQVGIPWYTADQRWAQVNEVELGKAMMDVFTNREQAMVKGTMAKDFVRGNFSFQTVGAKMRERLERIQKAL